MKRLKVETSSKVELIDITVKVKKIVEKFGEESGLVVLNVPHTTAGITINENADPDVKRDIVKELNKIVPFEDDYAHREGNSAAHIKSCLIGSSETIILESGNMQLGRWQGIYFCEFDGPRRRNVHIKVVG